MPYTRKPRPTPAPGIIINGNRVAWSFIKLVYKRLHCDWDNTIDVFWRARHCTGLNGIQRYIMSGFKPDKHGTPWVTRASAERENGKMESIRQWWIALYKPSERKQATMVAARAEFQNMLETLTESMSL